jgi:hypothetical protein
LVILFLAVTIKTPGRLEKIIHKEEMNGLGLRQSVIGLRTFAMLTCPGVASIIMTDKIFHLGLSVLV